MKLTLTVMGPGQSDARALSRVLTEGAMSIGRSAAADWTLEDPDRLLSKVHCQIEHQAGRFVLTDTSTNGVFINRSTESLGHGNTAVLNNGDKLQMGPFTIAVLIDAESGSQPDTRRFSLNGDPPTASALQDLTETEDWLPARTSRGEAPGAADEWPFQPTETSRGDHLSVEREFFAPAAVHVPDPLPIDIPAPGRGIPDDWFLESERPTAPDLVPTPAPSVSAPPPTESRYRALATGVTALAAGEASLRAILGCTLPDGERSVNNASAVADVLAQSMAHQAALQAALEEGMRMLDDASSTRFRKAVVSTYRDVFVRMTRRLAGHEG
jgi:type VI secretion system FHA domain protein